MNVIIVVNEKGGVGKTTLATHIAAGLAIKGFRTLMLDADAQGHATMSLGLTKEPGLYNLLVREAEFEDVLRVPPLENYAGGQTVKGSLYVLPSNVETRVIPMVISDAELLKDRLEELEKDMDVVVIDTSPTPSMLHASIYIAANHIVYPTECEFLSLEGLAETVKHTEAMNADRKTQGRPGITIMGVQPTLYRQNTNAHDYGLSILVKKFKRFTWPALPQRTIWVERSWANQTLFAYAPDHEATMEAWALVERVQKGLVA